MKKLYFICALMFSLSANAQEYTNLEEVNITNNRAAFQKNSIAGKDITVIDGKSFSQLAVLSLDDLLKIEGGIEVQQRGPAGSQSDIVIRGATYQQILVLIDGIKINDPITGHFSGYIPVAPGDIKRIEILKGPASAIYGSEAVGGVINIITNSFSAFKKEKKQSCSITNTMGEFGLVSLNSFASITNEKINLSLGVLSNNTRGQLLRSNNRGYFYNNTISASANIPLAKKWQLLWRSSIDMRDFAAQNFYTTFKSDTATEKVNSIWNQIRIKQTNVKSINQLDVVYKHTTDNYLYNNASIANDNKSNLITLNYLHATVLNPNFNLQYGASLEHKSIVSNDRGNHQNNHGAIFGAATIKYKSFNFNPGLRLVNDQNYGTEIIPQLNTSFEKNKFVLRGGIGRAIRAADFTERYNNYNKALVRGGSIGNPDLTVEKSWNYEMGVDFKTKNLKISATGFIRNQEKVIDFVTTPFSQIPRNQNLDSNGNFAFAKNVKTVDTKGLEFSAKYNWKINKNIKLNLSSSALFLNSNTSDSLPTFYILSHAKFLLQNNLVLNLYNFELSISSIYKERTASQALAINAVNGKSYFLTNGKMQYHFKAFSIFGSVQNIGNISYSDILGSIMPKRWISAGISAQF